jgi:hypothetical protein
MDGPPQNKAKRKSTAPICLVGGLARIKSGAFVVAQDKMPVWNS